jgi:hypothetical protein
MNKPITIMELNEFYIDHKTNIQSTELDLLKCAGFEDASFRNELCAKFSRPSKLGEYLNIHVCTVVIGEYMQDEDFLSAHFYQSNPLHPKNWIDDERPENLLGAKLDLPFISASSDVYVNGESEILTEDKRMPMNIQEAIIACTRFEEESLRSAKNKEKNLENYHKIMRELDNDQSDIFLTLQTIHAQWCKMHDLEFMCANDMLTVCDLDDYQREWLKAYGKAWDGMEEIKRFHGFAYNNAGEEL